jgi:hypothetical protein
MEAVAYVAGLPLSDQPECSCPVIAAFLRSWNDGLPSDAERDRLLKPLIPELIGTKSTHAVEDRRSYMALDWLIRVHTPAFLDRVESLKPHALELRSMEEIADLAGATAAGQKVRAACAAAGAAARAAAGAAARAAAGAAAWAAAGAASGEAARAAAGDAARAACGHAYGAAAWAAAGDAAWAAAGAAAGAAAWAAAGAAARAACGHACGDALKPTVDQLQASALDLVRRMIAVRVEAPKP